MKRITCKYIHGEDWGYARVFILNLHKQTRKWGELSVAAGDPWIWVSGWRFHWIQSIWCLSWFDMLMQQPEWSSQVVVFFYSYYEHQSSAWTSRDSHYLRPFWRHSRINWFPSTPNHKLHSFFLPYVQL